MRVYVKTSHETVPVDVKPSGTVASLKADYIGSGRFAGDAGFVALEFRGKTLKDDDRLKDYGIGEGAVVTHVEHARPGFRSIDYAALARSLDAESKGRRGGGQDPSDYPEYWDPKWTHGDEWMTYPNVVISDIWEDDDPSSGDEVDAERRRARRSRGGGAASASAGAGSGGAASSSGSGTRSSRDKRTPSRRHRHHRKSEEAIVPKTNDTLALSPKLRPRAVPVAPPGRRYKSVYMTEVGRCLFRVMHRMEGRWNGDAVLVTVGSSSRRHDARICSVGLHFDSTKARWVARQSLTSSDGITTEQTLHYSPVADGVLTVASDDPGLGHMDMRLEEVGHDIMMLTAVSRLTGKTVIVETITLVDDLHRVRSVQRFDESGAFSCMYAIKENRVIDAVSGAMTSGPSKFSL